MAAGKTVMVIGGSMALPHTPTSQFVMVDSEHKEVKESEKEGCARQERWHPWLLTVISLLWVREICEVTSGQMMNT